MRHHRQRRWEHDFRLLNFWRLKIRVFFCDMRVFNFEDLKVLFFDDLEVFNFDDLGVLFFMTWE